MLSVPNTLPEIPIVLIDEERKDRILQDGYKPVVFANSGEEENFAAEWRRVADYLESRLTDYWVPGVGDGDFFLDRDWTADRFVCIEVTTQRMLQPRLLRVAHETVLAFDSDYCVDVCNDWVFFEHPAHPEGNAGPHFYIFVEKTRILAYSKSDEILRRFGIH